MSHPIRMIFLDLAFHLFVPAAMKLIIAFLVLT